MNERICVPAAHVAGGGASPEPMPDGWRSMDSAPRDGSPIVGWCVHKADPYWRAAGRLTVYGAHVEGLGHVMDGPHVLVWGGEYQCDEDEGGGYIPNWWFRAGSEWEEAANPIMWAPVLEAPTAAPSTAGTQPDPASEGSP